MEIWKDIPGFDGKYQCSNEGRFKRLARKMECWRNEWLKERIIKASIHKTGYLYIGLMTDGKQKSYKAHRLIAFAFLEKVEGKDVINHKDGNKQNNHVDNLEWCTKSENTIHSMMTGLQIMKGDKAHNRKLTESQVIDIKKRYANNNKLSRCELAKEYRVSTPTIQSIIQGTNWGHVKAI